ncbi:corrinoid protein [Methanococcoides orientis]|uniref:cobalamin B12-binding domain-containing protein n=1 Tax=Methanococcoides orientis TaxID=2822137 RepID=UPI001E2A2D06|nr:corrinoid protein [Methanococcoides orientis]UGV41053.1 corrinoid protein [Methanococcoides orientis]
MSSENEILQKAYDTLVAIDEDGTAEAVAEWISADLDPVTLLNKLAEAMTEVGVRFETMEYYLPQVMIAAEIMNSSSNALSEKMAASGETSATKGTVVIGTIEGDIHDLGKNIVAGMLQASGFKVVDMGRDVPVTTMVQAAKDNNADIVAGSALMSTTMPYLGDIVKLLEGMGIRENHKVMVGGAPVSQDYADSIGADAYALNSHQAVEAAKKLVSK